jgi:hypothetical protein
MRWYHIAPVAAAAFLNISSAARAESDNIYWADPGRFGRHMGETDTNAVVNQGSGAVKPLGPGQNRNTAGIGGSATTAPRQPVSAGSVTAQPTTPRVHRTHHATRHHRATQHS